VRTQRGFTLIELLVVIAIIAILAAILFPVFARAREKARQSSCLSNSKQIMLAVLSYAQDYDEFLPYGQNGNATTTYGYAIYSIYDGRSHLMPYIKNQQIGMCPSNPTYRCGYGWNYPHMPYRTLYAGGWSLAQYQLPSEVMVFCDSNSYAWVYCPVHYPNWSDGYCRVSDRHNDGANCGFLDGHAKWEKRDTLLKTDTNGQRLWAHINY